MKKILLIAGLFTITGSVFAQKAYNLNFKPKQGEKYDAITHSVSSIKQSMMGKDMVIDMIYDVDMLYDVTKAAENTSLNMTYKKLVMDMAMMGQNMKMTSEEADDANPGSKYLKALKDATVSIIIAPDGKVVDVQGTEALTEKLADASPVEKETLKSFISKGALKSTIEQSFNIFPDKPVKAGDVWKKMIAVESPYKMQMDNSYKLIKVEDGLAYLDINGTISSNGAQKMTSNGMEMSMDLSGEQKGTITVDEKTGVIKGSDIVQNLKGKMEMMGQEIPMEIKTTSNLRLVKK